MLKLKLHLIFIGIFCFLSKGNTQNNDLSFEHINVEDGLSNNTVNAIIQDSEGFMWFGTWDGLCRYDGYSFKTFRPEKGNPNAISSNVIRSLLEDKDGVLWIGTENGLNKYNPKTESFVSYLHNPNDSASLTFNLIYNIFEDSDGMIWVGTRGGGVDMFDKIEEVFYHPFNFLHDTISIRKNVFAISEDKKGNIWIGGEGGYYFYNKESKLYKKYKLHDLPNAAISQYVDKGKDILWSGTWASGIVKTNIITKESKLYINNTSDPHSLSNNIVMTINEVKHDRLSVKNEIWIGTREGGLNIYDYETDNFISYKSSSEDENSISDNIILSIYQDRSGIVWLGTKMGGVNKVNINKKKFKTLKPSNINRSFDNKVMSVCADNSDNIWLGTGNSGILKINPIENKVNQYYYKQGSYNFKSSPINVIRVNENNENITVFSGSDEKGFECFISQKEFFSDLELRSRYITGALYSLYIGNDKTWVGSYGGLTNSGFGYIDNLTDQHIRVSLPENWDENAYLRVFSISKSGNDNAVLIGTRGYGMGKYNIEKDEFIFYSSDPSDPFSISHDDVFCIYVGSNNIVWVGTGGGGLNKFDPETEKFYHITKMDGLPSNVIYGILEDKSDNLWLSTTYGISKYTPKTNEFHNYNTKDGLLDNVYNYGSYYKSQSGEMFFGGLNGLTYFYPDSIVNNEIIPTVKITELRIQNNPVGIGEMINGRVVLTQTITTTPKINLKYSDRSFTLEFSAMDYNIPSKNKYEYKLEGFDNEWTTTDASKRFVDYTNLDAGKYTFKVRASNNDNFWNEKYTELIIQVHPPFWKTWLFRILVGVIVICSVILFYSVRTQRLKAYQKKLENEVRTRTAEVVMQKEEIEVQSENLAEANEVLKERQFEIENQAKELMLLNSTKDKFFSIIAHDLKNPFQGIISFSKLLLQKSEDTTKEKQKEFIELIHESSLQVSGLLNSLLQWSQTQTGNISLNPECFDLKEVIDSTYSVLELSAKDKNITLVNSVNDKVIAFADKNMVTTVVRNITNNAIKFTPEGGCVEIYTENTPTYIYVSIKDNGVGMSEKYQRNIFRIEEQHSNEGTSGETGTGLGLVICKEFVEKNGGELSVVSTKSDPSNGKEGGSTFTFTIPVSEEIPNETPETIEVISENEYKEVNAEDIPIAYDGKKPIILIADDHSHVRLSIKEYFEDTFQILEAVNGSEAFEYATETLPDLVISDVVMPDMNGVELCEKLKSDIRTSHIPIILLTGQSATEHKIKGFKTGADDYITKPFDVTVLKVRAANLIDSRIKLREIFKNDKEEDTSKLAVNDLDVEFLKKVTDIVDENISNVEFTVNDFLKEIGMSNSQLYRKLMAITGQSANEFIRNQRLKYAKKMLKESGLNISEVAYSVGFNSPSYFTKCFKEYFKVSPNELK